jgi:hypothetical protein
MVNIDIWLILINRVWILIYQPYLLLNNGHLNSVKRSYSKNKYLYRESALFDYDLFVYDFACLFIRKGGGACYFISPRWVCDLSILCYPEPELKMIRPKLRDTRYQMTISSPSVPKSATKKKWLEHISHLLCMFLRYKRTDDQIEVLWSDVGTAKVEVLALSFTVELSGVVGAVVVAWKSLNLLSTVWGFKSEASRKSFLK